MTMEDREKAFEKKYALDQELMFKIEARASRMFGQWAAVELGLSGDAASAFTLDTVSANLEESGFDDLFRFIEAKFAEKGVTYDRPALEDKILGFMEEARVQLTA